MNWTLSVLAGLLTGVLSGFGIGGGTLLVLWLTLVSGMDQLRAGGINLLYFVCCALPALYGHRKNGLIEKEAVLWCVAVGMPACVAAALFASRMDVTLLRRVFGVFLLFIGCRELFVKKGRDKEWREKRGGEIEPKD